MQVGYGQSCVITNYTTDDGLLVNNISQLAFDRHQNLWIGSQGGLSFYNGIRFFGVNDSLIHPRIHYFFKDHHQNLYFGDGFNNLFCINSVRKIERIIRESSEEELERSAIGGETSETFDRHFKNRQFLLPQLDYRNIVYYSSDTVRLMIDSLPKFFYEQECFLIDSFAMTVDNIGRWWSYQNNKPIKMVRSELPKDLFVRGLVFNTDVGPFALYNHKIIKLHYAHQTLYGKVVLDQVTLDKTNHQLIVGQIHPKTGQFFFGSAIFGMYKVSPMYFKSIFYNEGKKDYQAKYNNAFYSQAEFAPNTILIDNNYILRNQVISQIGVEFPFIQTINFIDSQHRLWCSDGNKMMVSDKGKLQVITSKGVGNDFNFILEYDTSRYFALIANTILEVINMKIVKKYTFDGQFEYSTERIRYLGKDDDRQIFILTDKNVYFFDSVNNVLTKIEGLPTAEFRNFHKVDDNLFFVSTYGHGYFLLNNHQFVKMPVDKNRYLKFAHTAVRDEKDFIWIPTNHGLFKTRLKNLWAYVRGKSDDVFYYYYDKSSGFRTNEFNGGGQNPGIALSNGDLSFCSMEGLVQVDPLAIKDEFPQNAISIYRVWVNDKIFEHSVYGYQFEPNTSSIKFELITPYFGHPDNLHIQYQLLGMSEKWLDLPSKSPLELQNLKPGEYCLNVRMRTGFEADSFVFKKIYFQVKPTFYETNWFFGCIFIIISFGIYVFNRWYNRITIIKNISLEKLIEVKSAELHSSNDMLRDQIKQNDLFQSIFVHDIKSPIRFISSNAALLKSHWSDLPSDLKLENIAHIYEASSKITHFLDETILWINIKNGKINIGNESFYVQALLHEMVAFYKEDQKLITGQIQIDIRCSENLQLISDKRLVATLIRNLLSNSLKYSKSGRIHLYADINENKEITLGCRDEGKGMSNEVIATILSENYKGNEIREDSFRFGYILIKEICQILHCQLKINSIIYVGTDVQIQFSHQNLVSN